MSGSHEAFSEQFSRGVNHITVLEEVTLWNQSLKNTHELELSCVKMASIVKYNATPIHVITVL